MRTRRGTELWLLIAAAPVVALLFAMLLVNDGSALTLEAFAVPIGLIAAFLVAHVALRKFAPGADPALLAIAFLLSGIGITFVLRLSPESAPRQVIWLFLGIALMIATVVFVPSVEKLGDYKYTCLLFAVLLLLLPLVPGLGAEHNGSKIWISVAGFSFQPGEIAKIFIVLFLAAYMADNRELLSTWRTSRVGIPVPNLRSIIPVVGIWVLCLLVVIFEKDLGSALLLFGIFLVLVYVSTGRLSYIALGLVLVAIAAVFLYSAFDHVQLRVAIWLDPFEDAQGDGYQLVQSLYSLADGGLFGVGIGRGACESIPVVESDFIFSAIAEECGLLGASAVIFGFMLFAVRGSLIASRAKSDMAAFTAAGLTTSISLQAFIIIGGVTDFIPLTGLTLPFMSQGGSSLLSSFIIVGLLLRASDEGTGLGTEMQTTRAMRRVGGRHAFGSGTGVLGRTALGKRLTVVIAFFAILFALLIANLTYVMVIEAEELQDMPSNNHTLASEATRERGAILTSDNVVLAESVEQDDGTWERTYPEGDLASQVVGYYSQQYGSAGIENSMSSSLVGEEDFETITDAIRAAAGIQTSGNDVVLTIDADIQKAAQEALGDSDGACVVLDTETGAVLAEASSPTYDNNDVEDIISGEDDSADLYNRATQSLYAPGSTFKIVTLAAALDTGTVEPDDVYSSPGKIEIGNAPVTNYNKTKHGKITVAQATAYSSNTVFAQIAVELGAEDLVSYAEAFGFNDADNLIQDFSLTDSLMPDPDEMTTWETAWAGAGQPVGEHDSPAGPQVTVMQMAVAMAAIANDGVAVKPYVVEKVLSPSGSTVAKTTSEIYGQVISEETAKTEQEILEGVVTGGTGTAAQISGATVIGKTGTAETSSELSDAWFVGTAEAGGESVTVAIVIEEGDSGGGVAAPAAKEVLECALEEVGAL